MTDFEIYTGLLDKAGTKYGVWEYRNEEIIVDVENDSASFSISFDIVTMEILSTEVYSKIYSE